MCFHQSVILGNFNLEQSVGSYVTYRRISSSELESWRAVIGKSASCSDMSGNSNSYFSETPVVNYWFKFWFHALILQKVSFVEDSLVLLIILVSFLESKSSSSKASSSNKGVSFFAESTVVCSIYPFFATLTKRIEARLGLLFCFFFILFSIINFLPTYFSFQGRLHLLDKGSEGKKTKTSKWKDANLKDQNNFYQVLSEALSINNCNENDYYFPS